MYCGLCCFFFKQKTAYEMRISDWSSDVCSSDLRMPVENASVLWPERLSPRVPVATVRIPRQTFDMPAQFAFCRNLSYNPWHCIAEHRPQIGRASCRERVCQYV